MHPFIATGSGYVNMALVTHVAVYEQQVYVYFLPVGKAQAGCLVMEQAAAAAITAYLATGVIAAPQQQELINALLLYMDQDACVCEEPDACPPDCEMCMFCRGFAALHAIGYYEVTHERERTQAPGTLSGTGSG